MSIVDKENSGKAVDGNGKDRQTGQFVKGNRFSFKKGQSGNPNGQPKKSAVLKELDAKLGDVPRMMLFQILDQAANGAKHFGNKTPMGVAISKMGVNDLIKIATYLDEQSNGKAKITTDIEGAIIVLSATADEL